MPCAKTQPHGKPDFCRVPVETAHGKRLAHVKPSLYRMSGQNTHGIGPTHGKDVHLPCAAYGSTRRTFSTRQIVLVCRVPAILHTAKSWHTTNLCQKMLIQHSQFFLIYIYSVLYSLLKSGIFLVILAIFSHLISLIEFLGLNRKCFE